MILATKYIAGFVVGLGMVGVVSVGHHSPICPDDFGTDDAGSKAYLVSVDAWTNSYFDSHADASMADWAQARKQFWIDNDCTLALQRYEDAVAGKADPETMDMIESEVQDAIQGKN